jgi:hypothetical protein
MTQFLMAVVPPAARARLFEMFERAQDYVPEDDTGYFGATAMTDLDALVEEKVFGRPLDRPPCTLWTDAHGEVRSVAPYSRDWGFAAQVIEEMSGRTGHVLLTFVVTAGWYCQFGNGPVAHGSEGPEVICRAAIGWMESML